MINMKKLFVLLIVIFILFSFGCVEDDVNSDIKDNNLDKNDTSVALKSCLSSAMTQEGIDDCYISIAKQSGVAEFCNDVSDAGKKECYSVIPSDVNQDAKEAYAESKTDDEGNALTGLFGLSFAGNTYFPTIEHDVIPFAEEGSDVTVNATVSDLKNGAKVYLVYKNSFNFGSQGWQEVEMTTTGGDNWQGTIPLSGLTVAKSTPSQLINGGFEEWDEDGAPKNWRLGWNRSTGLTRETNPENVAGGSSSWLLNFSPNSYHARVCNPGDEYPLKGTLTSEEFVIQGDVINFFGMHYPHLPFGQGTNYYKDILTDDFYTSIETPWGMKTNKFPNTARKYDEQDFSPKIQIIDSVGNILAEDFLRISDYAYEYELDVSEYKEQNARIRIVDNSFNSGGAFADSFMQIGLDGDEYVKFDFKNSAGENLANFGFEDGTFDNWTANEPANLWRLMKRDAGYIPKQAVKADGELFADGVPSIPNANWFATSRYVVCLSESVILKDSGRDDSYFNHTTYRTGDCSSMRARYEKTNNPRLILRDTATDKQVEDLIAGKTSSAAREVFRHNFLIDKEEGLGDYVVSSYHNHVTYRNEHYFGESANCPGTELDDDGKVECGNGLCEINIHGQLNAPVIAGRPYLLKYKAKTDAGISSSQIILNCDYSGESFSHNGSVMIDGKPIKYSIEAESRGKIYTGSRCQVDAGEWQECVAVIVPPKGTSICYDFRVATGKLPNGGNKLWLDDFTFSPLYPGLKYYIKVVDDDGEYSNVFEDIEKNWGNTNGNLEFSARRKSVVFSKEANWDNYVMEARVKQAEALGYQGYPWSQINFHLRAQGLDNDIRVKFNIPHDLIEIGKTINRRGDSYPLENPLSVRNGKTPSPGVRDYRPFLDDRTGRTTFEVGTWYNIKAEINENKLTVWYKTDGGAYIKAIEETLTGTIPASGGIALSGYEGRMLIDNLKVTSLSGQTLFEENFDTLNDWKIIATHPNATQFIAVGNKKDWQKVLTNAKPADLSRTDQNFSFAPTTARYVAITINDSHGRCRIRNDADSTLNYEVNFKPKLFDVSGNDVLANAKMVAMNTDPSTPNVWNTNKYVRFSWRVKEMTMYEPLGRVVLDLGENKTINKFGMYTYVNGYRTNNEKCLASTTNLPSDFDLELILEEDY
jgi:hypothetical protein